QALSVSFYRAIFLLPDRAALEADLKLAFDDLAELHDQAARAAADDITAALREIGSLETVAYDRLDPGAVAALQGYRDELIADLTGTMQDAIAQVLTSGVTAGAPSWPATLRRSTGPCAIAATTRRCSGPSPASTSSRSGSAPWCGATRI